MHYDFSLPEMLRNMKLILYFLAFLLMYSYLYKKFYRFNHITTISDVLKIFVFFATLIMLIMLLQIFYHFYMYGVPSISELVWSYSPNQRPYLYTERFISLEKLSEGIKGIGKGNHNATGILAVLSFFISLYFYSKTHSILYILSSITALVTLLMSFSRSSFVVFVLLLLMYSFVNNRLISKIKNLITIIVISLIIFHYMGEVLDYTILYKVRLTLDSILEGEPEPSSAERLERWRLIFSGKLNYVKLIFGNGFGAMGVLYFTNNIYFQMESLFLNILIVYLNFCVFGE